METLTQLVAECMARHGFPSSPPHEPVSRIEFARSLLLPNVLPTEEVLTEPSSTVPTPLPSGF